MIITKSAAGSASWIHGCFDYVLVIKKLTKQNHYEYIDVPIQKYSSNPTNYNTSVDSKTLQLLSCCNLKNIENSEKIQNALDFQILIPIFN